MNIPFLGNKRKKHRAAVLAEDPEGIAELLSECEVLRSHAAREGIGLDDSADSLEALDQLPPRWREDEESLPWFGHDAGLYLGTVVVRTVPGAAWVIRPGGEAVVRLTSGREIDVVTAGFEWAATGTPELSRTYAEVAGR
ncbi:hypothetical protein GCM10010269_47300 [Streptomyces humidus]|uniref:Uncharacterized protein n=1 Tax=Streptomyces humidus TaxID=52259 RepID=A0A918FZ98_9ACTN|nr:DUF6278 family protein [Streptomyces humidus]GGS02931.1 hypothetical protein GCM10010269_47300 [Streptomyces humidus]